jgi:Nucleotidyltransferase of unknown function (DUF6036)
MAKINLTSDFRDFLRLLNEESVEYVLIGGYAVILHGYNRYTADMDVWVRPSAQNSERLVRALRKFGFSESTLADADFKRPGQVFTMGIPPTRIDVLTFASGVDFDECYRTRTVVDIDGLPVNLISLSLLRKNKTESGRLQDQADLERLPPA